MVKNKKRSAIILSLVGGALLGALGWFIYSTYIVTHPLGNKLEYIGKHSYGCWVCDSNPTTLYFYSTDMRPEEIASYFKRTKTEGKDISNDQIDQALSLTTPNKRNIYVEYHSDGQDYAKKFFGLKKAQKSHLILIQSQDYEAVKEML